MADIENRRRPQSDARALDQGFVVLPIRGTFFKRGWEFSTAYRMSCTSVAMIGQDEFLGTHLLDGLEADQAAIVETVFADDDTRKFGMLVVSMSLDDPRLAQLRVAMTERAGGRAPDVTSIPGIPNQAGLLGGLGQLVCRSEVRGGERIYHCEVTGTNYQREGTAEELAATEPIEGVYSIDQ